LLLYYITDRTQFSGDSPSRVRFLLQKIREAAVCNVDYIQLREKDLSIRELETLAAVAVRVVREHSRVTRLLINSRTDVALACSADGVHLRSNDISPNEVRLGWKHSAAAAEKQLPVPVVGVSCHTEEEVRQAAGASADFVLFAPVFEKRSEPDRVPAGIEALREVCEQKVPVLALGGVTQENAQICVESGAAGIAGIRLFQENDVADVVRALQAC
jgi:thiamine-phosphate pyrophosphorylase